MKNKFTYPEFVNKIISDEEKMFKLGMGLKFFAVSLVCAFSVLLFTYLLVQIDLIFFIAHGFPGAIEFKDAFFEFVYSSLNEEIAWSLVLGMIIFFTGYYLSGVMLRPFKAIGQYCEDKMDNKKNYYEPDFFSDLKLLTSFSVFFFSKIDEAKIREKLSDVEIPDHFTGIHKPNFEKNFFFNYFFVVVILGLVSSLSIIILNLEVREQIFQLSSKFLMHNKQAEFFLEEQFMVANIGVYFLVGMHLVLYVLLGIHMYSKVATPSFAVFATMRSFLRGNYHNRIHLIGFYYLRSDCRKINKYLDHVQKSLT